MSALSPVRTASGGIFRHKVQAFVLCMVLLVSTGSATLGLALLQANNGPFDHAFASQDGSQVTLTVNADQATAAEMAASTHASGVTAAAGQTLVLVTHDPALARRHAARTIQLVDGMVVDGTVVDGSVAGATVADDNARAYR